jgi:hypothetical protein
MSFVVRRKFQLDDDVAVKIVLDKNGAELDDDNEPQLVCNSEQSLMFLLPGEKWTTVTAEV